MAEARSKNAWQHTATLLALLANLHRDPKSAKAYAPNDFNPHHRPKPIQIDSLHGMRGMFETFTPTPEGEIHD